MQAIDQYATAEECAAVTRPATPDEIWLAAQLDRIDPQRDEIGGAWNGPALDGEDDEDCWEDRMQEHVNGYLRDLDLIPHHFQMHFMHAAEIVGYKHPDHRIRLFWNRLYVRLVHDMHVWPETVEQLDARLGDSRSGWLVRADPATIK